MTQRPLRMTARTIVPSCAAWGTLLLTLAAGCASSVGETPPSTVATAPAVTQPPVAAGAGSGASVAPPAEKPLEGPPGVAAPAVVDCGTTPADMACVPGGWHPRGVDEDRDGCKQADEPRSGPASMPKALVWNQTFWMDKYEVTIGDYGQCMRAGKCPKAAPLYQDFSDPKQPMTGGNWYDAAAYCEWRGKRLPTEAEFELAARGPEGEKTPFGNELVSCENAVIMDERGRSCGITKRGSQPEKGKVLPVGSRAAGRYGIFDLVGNAEEWVADWWSPSWESCGEACLGINPTGPCGGGAAPCKGHSNKTVRGGSWYWGPECATGIRRRRHVASNSPPHHFGFRCAADQGSAVRLPNGGTN